MSSTDAVIDFYNGGKDSDGRTLEAILAWSDEQLETVHDFIKWVFPSRRPSNVNPFAPLVTDETVRAFDRDPALRAQLRHALERMLRFYGLRSRDGRVEIDERAFAARSRVWLAPGNHNHLRLTRIMDSLSTLGLRTEALALQHCLIEDVCRGAGEGRVATRTIEFWSRAVSAGTE